MAVSRSVANLGFLVQALKFESSCRVLRLLEDQEQSQASHDRDCILADLAYNSSRTLPATSA